MIRLLNAIAFLVAVSLAVALYLAKTEAKGAQDRLERLQAELAEERRQISVLTVEIAHLEEPDRLRALARRYLGFEPLDPNREVALSDLPMLMDAQEPREVERPGGLLVVSDTGDSDLGGGPQ